ncbi:MAG: hypothetical protein NTX22_09280 [Ignavibacteriales bacterium]|nr:hypothetical protein [Ignavibacteriales bacterium]
MKKSVLILSILFLINTIFFAQLKFGTDIYSRYIWRGLNLGGDSPSLQPGLSYTISGFTVGFWGAYSYPGNGTTYSENDFFASYSLTTETAGTFSLLYTDYYIPSLGIPFGYFQRSGGAHILEGGLSYAGPAIFPVLLSGYYNIHCDPDNSVYLQVGYPFTIGEATLTLAAGYVPTKSAYYLTDKAAFINLSITASKSIVISDKFSLPINVSYINNPKLDISYLAFGASFTL